MENEKANSLPPEKPVTGDDLPLQGCSFIQFLGLSVQRMRDTKQDMVSFDTYSDDGEKCSFELHLVGVTTGVEVPPGAALLNPTIQ